MRREPPPSFRKSSDLEIALAMLFYLSGLSVVTAIVSHMRRKT
jgi:hypothetical protein